MAGFEVDAQVRRMAFAFLDEQVALYGEVLRWSVLSAGFEFDGRRLPLIGPQGIFKPSALPQRPLSIATAPPREGLPPPYADGIDEQGWLIYRYPGTDRDHRDNAGLCQAMLRHTPLIDTRTARMRGGDCAGTGRRGHHLRGRGRVLARRSRGGLSLGPRAHSVRRPASGIDAMSFRVVCISREIGAGGESVGQELARRLSYRYVDDEIIQWAARQAQVDPAVVAGTEHAQPLLTRLLAKLPAARDLAATLGPIVTAGSGGAAQAATRGSPEDLRILIRAAILEVARVGQAVIVAHAASIALAGREGVLRVLITASPATRAACVAARQQLGARDAARAVADSDRERRHYLRRFYGIEVELPIHYDLTINTDALTPEHAASVIAAAGCSG